MAAITTDAPRRARGRSAFSIGSVFGAFGDWRRARAAEAALSRMPEHLLDDLGITRGQIVDAVRNGRR